VTTATVLPLRGTPLLPTTPVTVLRRDGRGPLGRLALGAAPRRLHSEVYPVLVASHAGAEPADLVVHGTTATVLLGDEQ
jgi:hypothetical protein